MAFNNMRTMINRSIGVSYHLYADDTQVYLPLRLGGKDGNVTLLGCLEEVKLWMATNLVQLNETKTEIIILGRTASSQTLVDQLGPWKRYPKEQVKNLGVIFDSSITFDRQIRTVVRNCFFYLRAIAKLKPILSASNLEKVLHAYIFSRLDYCSALYVGTCQTHIARLQLVQNAAARLLMNGRKTDHVTPFLSFLGWLPIHFRVQYKILIYVFKSLHGMAPEYLAELNKPYGVGVRLRSANKFLGLY